MPRSKSKNKKTDTIRTSIPDIDPSFAVDVNQPSPTRRSHSQKKKKAAAVKRQSSETLDSRSSTTRLSNDEVSEDAKSPRSTDKTQNDEFFTNSAGPEVMEPEPEIIVQEAEPVVIFAQETFNVDLKALQKTLDQVIPDKVSAAAISTPERQPLLPKESRGNNIQEEADPRQKRRERSFCCC